MSGKSEADADTSKESSLEAFPTFATDQQTLLPAPESSIIAQTPAAPARRGRRRTTTLVGASNPTDCPIAPQDHQLATLINRINRQNRSSTSPPPPRNLEVDLTRPITRIGAALPTELSTLRATPLANTPEASSPTQSSPSSATPVGNPNRTNSPTGTISPAEPSAPSESITPTPSRGNYNGHNPVPALPFDSKLRGQGEEERGRPLIRSPLNTSERRTGTFPGRAPNQSPSDKPAFLSWEDLRANRPSPRIPATPTFEPHVRRVEVSLPSPHVLSQLQGTIRDMNSYPNYLDSPQAGPSQSPRQAPPSPSQGMHQNGMNGGMGIAGGMVGFPTPAGHQSDLNYIMQMVEELAGQLSHNQALTAGIVDKMGKVRAKAKNLDLSNDELLAIAASELNVSSDNLEKENSDLRKALEKAIYEKKENWKLAVHGANILSDILDKMHKFKAQHEADTLAWHRNYRKQLSDEREENLNLRNQINDMKAAACRANAHLREMRRYLTDHDELHKLRVENIALRQERRQWKRMAMPLIPQDDPMWSDDDDIIDPEEKKRQAAERAEKERKDKEGGGGGGEDGGDTQGSSA